MLEYRFERECRTQHSESYSITEEGRKIGRLDLHFTYDVVEGSLIVPERLTSEEIDELIQLIDQELVPSSGVPRTDFIVNVFAGREVGLFSDEDFEEDDEASNGRVP